VKIWLSIFMLMISLLTPGMIFCQQEQALPETRAKEGVVTDIDSIGSILVIFDGMQELRFSVDQGARIQRGTENIMLDDLESNDTVTVEYYKSADGALKAVAITDNNVAASF